jgi:hypothetical protein
MNVGLSLKKKKGKKKNSQGAEEPLANADKQAMCMVPHRTLDSFKTESFSNFVTFLTSTIDASPPSSSSTSPELSPAVGAALETSRPGNLKRKDLIEEKQRV